MLLRFPVSGRYDRKTAGELQIFISENANNLLANFRSFVAAAAICIKKFIIMFATIKNSCFWCSSVWLILFASAVDVVSRLGRDGREEKNKFIIRLQISSKMCWVMNWKTGLCKRVAKCRKTKPQRNVIGSQNVASPRLSFFLPLCCYLQLIMD